MVLLCVTCAQRANKLQTCVRISLSSMNGVVFSLYLCSLPFASFGLCTHALRSLYYLSSSLSILATLFSYALWRWYVLHNEKNIHRQIMGHVYIWIKNKWLNEWETKHGPTSEARTECTITTQHNILHIFFSYLALDLMAVHFGLYSLLHHLQVKSVALWCIVFSFH